MDCDEDKRKEVVPKANKEEPEITELMETEKKKTMDSDEEDKSKANKVEPETTEADELMETEKIPLHKYKEEEEDVVDVYFNPSINDHAKVPVNPSTREVEMDLSLEDQSINFGADFARELSMTKNGKSSSSQCVKKLQDDSLRKIFSHLPVKSIARNRSLSKYWNSQLRHTTFTDLFMRKSRTRPQLLLCLVSTKIVVFSPQDHKLPQDQKLPVSPLMRFPFHANSTTLPPPVRGLLCYDIDGKIDGEFGIVLVVANPSTGQSLRLPKLNKRCLWRRKTMIGYEPYGKMFKVLTMGEEYMGFGMFRTYEILTLGDHQSWRMIQCSLHQFPRVGSTDEICLKGRLYYVGYQEEETERRGVIVCFDLRTEIFSLIEEPKENAMRLLEQSSLVNYHDRLAFVVLDRRAELDILTRSLELWSLVNPEKNEWEKLLCIIPPLWKQLVRERVYIVGFIGDEILMSPGSMFGPLYIYFFDTQTSAVRRVEVTGVQGRMGMQVRTFCNHLENLVPLQV